MARAYASIALKASADAVWSFVRDFNGLPKWAPSIAKSEIEDGLRADTVGCVRSFYTHDGTHIRERLLIMDDLNRTFTYNFEKPAFPVRNYFASLRVLPITATGHCFADWTATFDEGPGDEGKYEQIISTEVFAANFANLEQMIAAGKIGRTG
jgi:hypothetical protein